MSDSTGATNAFLQTRDCRCCHRIHGGARDALCSLRSAIDRDRPDIRGAGDGDDRKGRFSPIARQTLVAYVAGVGEAAGAIVDTIGNGSRTVSCRKSFSLDTGSVRVALEAGAPRQDSWSQTPATPLIVADMVKRAGCRAKD